MGILIAMPGIIRCSASSKLSVTLFLDTLVFYSIISNIYNFIETVVLLLKSRGPLNTTDLNLTSNLEFKVNK